MHDSSLLFLSLLFDQVNCLRAAFRKNLIGYIQAEDPDIICLEEVKCSNAENPLTGQAALAG